MELIAQRVRPHHVERFAEHEAALVPALELLDLDATITVVREWVERADALVDMSRRFLRDHETPKTAPGRQRPGVNVVIDAPALAALELRELGIGTVGDLDEFLGGQPTTAAVQAWYRSGLEYLMGNEHSAATTLSGHYLSPALAAAFCCDTTMRRLLTTGSAPRRPTTSCSSARGQGGAEVDSCARSEEPAALPRSQCGSPTLAGTTASTERRLGDRTRDPTRSRVIGARHHHVLHRDGWSAHLEPDGTLAVAGPHDRHWAT